MQQAPAGAADHLAGRLEGGARARTAVVQRDRVGDADEPVGARDQGGEGDDRDGVLAAVDERLGLLGLDRVEDDHVRAVVQRLVGLGRLGARVTAGVVDAYGALLAPGLDPGLEGLDVDPGREALGPVGDQEGDDGRVLPDAAGEQAAAQQHGEEGGEGAHRGTSYAPPHLRISRDRSRYERDATRSRSSRPAAAPRR